MILGLTGPMASGKSTVLSALEKLGYIHHITLSDMIRDECKRRGIPETRENLMNAGQSMRREHGAGILAERVLGVIQKRGYDKWVIDGIRNPAEVEVLRRLPDFFLIANTAPEKLIIKRILSRARPDDALDVNAIKRKLRRELGEGEPPEGQQVKKCIEMADYVFENTMEMAKVEGEFGKLYDKIAKERSS